MHAPANVLLAVRYALPTIVVIRTPVDAVLSEVIRQPRKRLRRGLLEWNSFYATVRPVLDRVVVADFATVTTDYAVVIDEVNRRFGTNFVAYHNSAEADEAVFASIEAGAGAGKSGSRLETQVPRPSKERADRKAALEAELERPELASSSPRASRCTPSTSPSLLGPPEARRFWWRAGRSREAAGVRGDGSSRSSTYLRARPRYSSSTSI